MVQMNVTVPPHQKGPALSCMDYGHHDPIHAHRVYRFQAVERALHPLCDDDGKPGDDDGNPYTVMLHFAQHLATDRDRPFASLRVTWCDCANYQGLFFTLEPCLNEIIRQQTVGRD
jgi:hypothetical protein